MFLLVRVSQLLRSLERSLFDPVIKARLKILLINAIGGALIALGPVIVTPFYISHLDIAGYAHMQRFLMAHIFVIASVGTVLSSFALRELIDPRLNNSVSIFSRFLELVGLAFLVDFVLILLVLIACALAFAISNSISLVWQYEDILLGISSGLLASWLYLISGYYLAKANALANRLCIASPIVLNLIGLILLQENVSWIILVKWFVFSHFLVLAGLIVLNFKSAKKIAGKLVGVKFNYLKNIGFFLALCAYVLSGIAGDNYYRFIAAVELTDTDFSSVSTTLMLAGIVAMVVSVLNLTASPIFYRHADEWIENGIWERCLIGGFIVVGVLCLALIGVRPFIFDYFSSKGLKLSVELFSSAVAILSVTSITWVWVANIAFYQKAKKTIIFAGASGFIAVVITVQLLLASNSFNENIIYAFAVAQILPIIITIALNETVRKKFPYFKVGMFIAMVSILAL